MYNRNLVFTAACIGMLLFGMVFLSLGTVLTFIKESYNLSELSAGTLTAILPFGILAGSLIFGPSVDRYGYKLILIISSILILIAFEIIAFTNSYTALQIAFFFIGFGGGVINGATNALVSDISSEGKGANLSFLGVFFGIGAMGMPAVIGLLSDVFPYSTIISVIGYFILIPVLYFLIIKFPVPKHSQGFPIKEVPKLFNVLLFLLAMVLFFESAIEGITNNWTTSFLEQGISINPQKALLALTILNAALLLARLVLGFLLKKIRPYIVLYSCLFLILIGAVVLFISSEITTAYIGIALLGIGFAPGFPVVLGYIGELYPDLTGTAFSFAITIALIGNTAINWLVGTISQEYGIINFPLVIIGCVILMMLVLSTGLKRISKQIKI
ncbi:MAG: MFS transporter [Ignavibacteriales bacterium]|nr:MAG: MFS transporter [Ignavibacteriales bacterium]